MRLVAATAALSALLLALPAQAQRSAILQAGNTGELAELCSATPKDPQGDAKINFCHGFAQGAIQVELRRATDKKAFCFPSPPPRRTVTMNEFVNWVKAVPDRKTPPAVEGFFQFLGERFPCK
ncbi:MAG TPA: Rap1a/Tai family immunity protein [Acetobacteraceae bacterium]|nr:Rap1a/Tai family immunity protein [Acetobacteraceae bacterium]